jgi:hypothetical protein
MTVNDAVLPLAATLAFLGLLALFAGLAFFAVAMHALGRRNGK